MTTSPLLTATSRRASVHQRLELAQAAAAKAEKLHGERMLGRLVAVHPALAELLPDGGLRAGGTYAVTGSHGLVSSLLSVPSADGLWCGVVGLPSFSAEAARALGCDLDRLVFVPRPGLDWVNVVGALIDALAIVVVHPQSEVSPAEASRLSARLRKRDAVLVSTGPWPRVEARIAARASQWVGLGRGHGHLVARQLAVEASARSGGAATDKRSLWLPDPVGRVRQAGSTDVAATELGDACPPQAMAG